MSSRDEPPILIIRGNFEEGVNYRSLWQERITALYRSSLRVFIVKFFQYFSFKSQAPDNTP